MIPTDFIRGCWLAGIRYAELCLQEAVNLELALHVYGEMELAVIIGWKHKQPRFAK